MNCRTCQHELSQCLDGRLPSGRRAAVMQHADGCPACAAFWSELQQAQELILRLPRQRTGPEFREALWERIQSGEGTPPAVFHEPVPMATRVRYVATGAAAAALLLITFHLGTNRTSVAPEKSNPVQGGSPIADGALQVSPTAPPPAPGLTARLAGFEPFTPTLMGKEAALQFDVNLAQAKEDAERLPRSHDDGMASRLCNRAGEMTRLGRVLLELQAHDHVSFPESVGNGLKLVVDQVDRLPHRSDPATAAGLATVLHGVTPLNLRNEIRGGKLSYSCSELEGFQRRWAEQPDVFRLLFIAGPETGGACPDQLHFSLSLVPQGDCESRVLVAPRSRMQVEGYRIIIGTGR